MRDAGRVVDAGVTMLDRQVVDCNGRLAGKVDDLEFTEPDDGGAPVLTAILSGPGALAHRLGGRIGAWLESVHARLVVRDSPVPARVSFGVVKRLGNHIELSVAKADLPVNEFEAWAADAVINHIPGSGHAPD